MKKQLIWIIISFLCVTDIPLSAQSIAEKKANLKGSESDLDRETDEFLFQVNKETQDIYAQIQELYHQAFALYSEGAPIESYKGLLDQINDHKRFLSHLENSWRETAARTNRIEGYGLWHAPETTLEQLIIDYGSQDYVYLIPPEVGSIKLSIASNLPIPRSAWSQMLELILSQNGVGIKTHNPYLRQLFLIKQNNSNLKLITNSRCDLDVLPADARITFVLSPEPSEVRRAYHFLEKFIHPHTTVLQILGRDILLTGQACDIQDLLRLYDFIAINRGDKEYRLIPMHKIRPEEMARILAAMFDQSLNHEAVQVETEKGPIKQEAETNGLRVVVLEDIAQALFVVGTKEEVKQAEEIICQVESQIGGARDKEVFWYTVKHSEAEELADVLYRIYNLMITTGVGAVEGGAPGMPPPVNNEIVVQPNVPPPGPSDSLYPEGGGFVIDPVPALPGVFVQTNPNRGRDNFIVDLKTGSIVMVVEADILPKIKELLRKLDVPKKMVQIETLLFEKVLTRDDSFGMNLLRLGDFASQTNFTGAFFNKICPGPLDYVAGNSGVFEFFISRKKNDSFPAFDLAYRFLLTQDDIQINSCPSILTINQTPAIIAINQDISINTGVYEVGNVNGTTALKDAFTRAQYGTTISIKPTIHMRDEESIYDYVTLETDITFDTIHPGDDRSRPDVTRRHINNQVQVVDGETVILGGLRSRMTKDCSDSIPFLGELPGIGKLFSETSLKDSTTEMFIFITPRIVHDPKEELACMRQDLLCRRPGDLPYFLECLEEAHQYDKNRILAGTLNILYGAPPARYYVNEDICLGECEGEYDGR